MTAAEQATHQLLAAHGQQGGGLDLDAFLDRPWEAPEKTDLVISRAGALTVSELAASLGLEYQGDGARSLSQVSGWGEAGPDRFQALNWAYTETARMPLCPFDPAKAVGFKMRFVPQRPREGWLQKKLQRGRFERNAPPRISLC